MGNDSGDITILEHASRGLNRGKMEIDDDVDETVDASDILDEKNEKDEKEDILS